jgi:hypothetical protein
MGPTRHGGSWDATIDRVETYALKFFGQMRIDQIKPGEDLLQCRTEGGQTQSREGWDDPDGLFPTSFLRHHAATLDLFDGSRWRQVDH